MCLQHLMKRDMLSPPEAKLGLIVSELALLSKQLDQFTSQAVGVSATASQAVKQVIVTLSNDVTLTEVFFTVYKLRLNLTVLVPS